MSSFLENTQKLINKATEVAQISGDMLTKLEKPNHVLEFEIPVEMDDGTTKKFQGWRVQHNNALGPYKGGIRYHPDSNLDEAKALASLMTWKTSLMGIPYGGGKGAIRVDPKGLSKQELERLSRGYVRAIWKDIGPEKDIPAPDVNTTPEIMDWMTDEYSILVGKWTPAAFTGKSVEKGGSKGREIATGFGGYVVLREFLKVQNSTFVPSSGRGKFKIQNSPSVAIQGFGNVGANIAKILFENDFKIVAISDSKGALFEEKGVDIARVLEVKEKTGTIPRDRCYSLSEEKKKKDLPCRTGTNEELLETHADILIPAALESVITEKNAKNISAKIILEMANGPITSEADAILEKSGIEVIPDILANGGGVVGSYFEWVQSKENKYWIEEEVLEKIDKVLADAFALVLRAQEDFDVSMRLASYIRAITRVAERIK